MERIMGQKVSSNMSDARKPQEYSHIKQRPIEKEIPDLFGHVGCTFAVLQ
jgi:hypothetical protein